MRKKVTQIREMEVIENEFNNAKIGILAFKDHNDKVNQTVIPFIYVDKNIYIFFDENDENFEKIAFDDHVNFIIKDDTVSDGSAVNKSNGGLKYFTQRVSGIIKKVEDNKTIEDLYKVFVQKYASTLESTELFGDKLVLIDTEEIQAMNIELS